MKQKPINRILALVLAIIMVVSVLPAQAFATDTDETQDPVIDTEQEETDTPNEEEPPEELPEEGEEVDVFANPVDASSADELESALAEKALAIRITADFALDRTFYITSDTAIFTEQPHTLTRAPGFGGDIFVVGEAADGTICEDGAVLTLGHPESAVKDMLVIDGNKDRMTAAVTGSVLFVVGGAGAELYENVTIANHKKVGNEKTLTNAYGVSYVGRVGGAVAIIADKASMDIYGGTYSNNSVNDIVDSSTEEGQVSAYGGAFYNFGVMNVYGGVYQNNHAARGGVFYCYRTTRIYNAQILNNTASTYGGAVYMPNSTAAFLFLGGENSYTDSRVIMMENTAVNNGGAIYAKNKIDVQDAQFIRNSALQGSGGAITAGETEVIVTNTVFDGNTAAKYGGAIYYAGTKGKEDIKDLTCVNTVFKNSSVSASGGALYMNGEATAYMENAEFTLNTATNNGGAIYLNNANIDIDGGSFTQNSCASAGGAIAGYEEAAVKLNNITGSKNSAKSGGFTYCETNTSLHIYDSTLQENTTTGNGGAVCLYTGAHGGIYNTTFHKNISGGNGGALFVYTDVYSAGEKLELHSNTYTNNEGGSGGAIYASQRSVIDLYNSTAKYNSADKGGFLYHTTTNTTINLASLILEGNTAVSGGPIIWGNSNGAVLNLDKSLYIDRDVTGNLDDAYWAAAIYNMLKVKEAVINIPNYIGYTGEEVVPVLPRIPVDITSAQELEDALAAGKDLLHITADFTIDRTFYIWRNTTIYTTEAHTLTRAADFGGDIFVVGERAAGESSQSGAILTLGDPESTQKDLLTIDGNKKNMTATVTGSVLFVVGGAGAELYENVTITNHKKMGNEKTLTGEYGVSYVERVGGAVAILAAKSSMNIYGGTYSNNEVNDVSDATSSQGGAIYNFGKLYVYGGTFEGNYAARGGVFYGYRTTNIYRAEIKNNSAASLGGVIYMPSSTAAILNIGTENAVVKGGVTFTGNSSGDHGGVIYGNTQITIQNTTFTQNAASGSGGAIIAYSLLMDISNCTFEGNTSGKYGGAIYLSGHNSKGKDHDLTLTDCSFTSNSSASNGGAIYLTTNAAALAKSSAFTTNGGASGGAIYCTESRITAEGTTFTQNTATGSGGGVTLNTSSTGVFSKITATGNTANAAGFLYAKASQMTMYRSEIKQNGSTGGHGGAIYLDNGASGGIYATDFTQNTVTASSANGGALAMYTGLGEVIIHSCTFTGNSSTNFGGAIWASGKTVAKLYNITATTNSAPYGGFLYETTASTVMDLVGVTVSGNTATTGGPIIWGNTTNAVMKLDKAKFTDLDHTGELDSAYWSSAIVNKLTVKEISEEIPKWLDYKEEAYDHMADAVDVSTAQQLEDAIASGAPFIRVIGDIEVDRTFYITGTTTIFSTLPRKLTRAPGFGGDLFVVGENKDGKSALLLGGNAKLVLGNPLSEQENLLVIDGNKDHMTVPVVGSTLFISYSGSVDLYANVTAMNMYKVDNERSYNEAYQLSRPNRIGGALAVVASGSLNIYGGIYRDNLVNEEDASTEETRNCTIGGLIYNNSNVYIYGGTFQNNQAARGGIIYNYKILKIYGGSFIGNTATVIGGVIYAPNAAGSHTHIGSAEADGAQVLFQNNSSIGGHGGAMYVSALCTTVIHGNTTFEGNTSTGSGGAICSYGSLTVRNTVFTGNTAKNQGGAVYIANNSATYLTRINHLEGCTFENNVATLGGAMSLYSSNSEFENGSIATVTNCEFVSNQAASAASKSAASYGGAIYVERKSSLTLKESVFEKNTARTEGGAIYAGGASTLSVADTDFTENAILDGGKNGGAVSIHSVTLDLTGVEFTGNTAVNNAGALYISYASAYDRNAQVTVKDSTFNGNSAGSLGGAVYVTKQAVTKEERILTASNTSFTGNSASEGGAMFFITGTTAYMTDTTFTENAATENGGGAIATSGGKIELDAASFTGNTAEGSGAAIHVENQAEVVLNAVNATENSTQSSGGFAYCTESTLMMYDSVMQANTAVNNAGALALYAGALANIYNTQFINNSSGANGGGVFLYTNLTPCVIHSCTFTGNSGAYGGAIYASNKSVASIYNVTARNNASSKGGFLYQTTTDTELTLVGATVAGNSATSGGPIIWGNSTGAVLHLNKAKFTDEDHSGSLNTSYWTAAITNKLTVKETSAAVPSYAAYQSKRKDDTTTPVTKKPVPVQDVFALSQSSSDADINSTYAKFPKLDNSSNFMSKNVTTFENINGGTVTVDSFIYPEYGIADNCNVGMGLLIWQAICYKQAYPEQEVHVDVASYRFSVQAAVNINRNSRYFGYMRQLSGKANYDQYGFVRIAYLLITAAKMGIHVNTVGHIDAYPVSADSLKLYDYFTTQLNDPCDPAYVPDGVIGDYLNFTQVAWDLSEKGGTDMMHTKMCAVSHYLDMNGVAHENAVFSSSSNLDGITSKGYNANWKVQTGTIVTGHEALYKTTTNYLRLIPQYSGQEGVYQFQNLVNRRSTEQAQMILAGRESEIPEGEQIIYLGRDTDKVFELYFTPMGGDILAWDEVQNPYCKYLRKLYDSEDYILFTWNAAEYNGNFSLGRQIESMIIAAFHDNRNVNNKIYGRMEHFDATSFDDLVVGVDIGFKSFNQLDFGYVHNKDVQFSYVENGQRYYVSLLNSMNFHGGSMYYQSNFALVIKETTCSEDSVFSTVAKYTTKGDMVSHTYGVSQSFVPEDPTQDGYTYEACTVCGHIRKSGTIHRPGEWIIDREATETQEGIRHRQCLVCDELVDSSTFAYEVINPVDLSLASGKTFTSATNHIITMAAEQTPVTFEATIQVPKKISDRAGVIVGNYASAEGANVNLEVYTQGRIRLYFTNNGKTESCVFSTDIRSDSPTHIAVTVDGTTATLYVDGQAVETKQLSMEMPRNTGNYMVGGDHRAGNLQYFKGTIYSVSLFSNVRTPDQILGDCVLVPENTEGLLYTEIFFAEEEDELAFKTVTPTGMTFAAETPYAIDKTLSAALHTIEATIQVPKSMNDRAGVIVGNYGTETGAQMCLEVYKNGRLRLFYLTEDGQKLDCVFGGDVRSDTPVHIAVTISGTIATLYINGKQISMMKLTVPFPEFTKDIMIGGDNRNGNTQYFRGTIYGVNLFSDVRTVAEIKHDMLVVPSTEHALLYGAYFVVSSEPEKGGSFSALDAYAIGQPLTQTPHTIEATIQVPKSMNDRAGVIVGNYGTETGAQMCLEVYKNGRLRLFYLTEDGQKLDCVFGGDVRSDTPVHIAVTISGTIATLYINGKQTSKMKLTVPFPEFTQDIKIGGDNRPANTQHFKGIIHSVSLFDDVRTISEIQQDMVSVSGDAEGLLFTKQFTGESSNKTGTTSSLDGKNFTADNAEPISQEFAQTLKTIEATIHVPKNIGDRAGTIIGNYSGGSGAQMNLEIYTYGKVRLHFSENGVKQNLQFKKDIRSDGPVHIAITLEDSVATLYVNGKAVETVQITGQIPHATKDFLIGGDNRTGNAQYFKGTIYSVNLFSDVRTAEEIKQDAIFVPADADCLLYRNYFTTDDTPSLAPQTGGMTFSSVHGCQIAQTLTAAPHTIEAVVQMPKTVDGRGGVIVGNYGVDSPEILNLEIYNGGRVRLYYKSNGKIADCIFPTDIRSDSPVHIAVTVSDTVATLYINGTAKDVVKLDLPYTGATENFRIGGDNRKGNTQYFRGTIYSVNLFSDVRTSQEIKQDMLEGTATADCLLYSRYFTVGSCAESTDGSGHVESDWIIDRGATETETGIMHTQCVQCGMILRASQSTLSAEDSFLVDYSGTSGLKPQDDRYKVDQSLTGMPMTYEVMLQLPTDYSERAGVLFGNYNGGNGKFLNLEIYTNGRPRLWYKINTAAYYHVFKTDIRSENLTHVAFTIDGLTANLYVNGELVETATLTKAVPATVSDYFIGTDNRADNPQPFAGTIYAVNLFDDVRTAEEIALDAVLVPENTEGLLFSHYFSEKSIQE